MCDDLWKAAQPSDTLARCNENVDRRYPAWTQAKQGWWLQQEQSIALPANWRRSVPALCGLWHRELAEGGTVFLSTERVPGCIRQVHQAGRCRALAPRLLQSDEKANCFRRAHGAKNAKDVSRLLERNSEGDPTERPRNSTANRETRASRIH